jgi:hypothetical protein
LQRGVGHGVELVRALVLEEIAAGRIKGIVLPNDSEDGHESGMRACAPLLLVPRQAVSRHLVVVTLENKIIAEESPFAQLRGKGRFQIKAGELPYKYFDFHAGHHL